MGWNDFYRRRDALDAVLGSARRDPAGRLPFAEVPGLAEVFTDQVDLLLALHYKWTLKFTGKLGMALGENADPVDAVTVAWRQASAENATLRTVLDVHAPRYEGMRLALEAEQRTLALTAGLAEPHEHAEEITRVGAAFLALLRSAPAKATRERRPVERFIRRLVASA